MQSRRVPPKLARTTSELVLARARLPREEDRVARVRRDVFEIGDQQVERGAARANACSFRALV